jgi:hypothetical protein
MPPERANIRGQVDKSNRLRQVSLELNSEDFG